MSQIIKNLASGPVPPAVPTSFVTDDGTAIPLSNVLNVNGKTSTDDNTNGIQTAANPDLSKFLEIQLTNRIIGSATTSDAGSQTQTLFTFPLAAFPGGTYLFYTRIVGFNQTDNLSAAYASYRAFRTDGTTPTLISANTTFESEEGAMTGVLVANGFSVTNDATLTVTGIAAKTISWTSITEYMFIS